MRKTLKTCGIGLILVAGLGTGAKAALTMTGSTAVSYLGTGGSDANGNLTLGTTGSDDYLHAGSGIFTTFEYAVNYTGTISGITSTASSPTPLPINDYLSFTEGGDTFDFTLTSIRSAASASAFYLVGTMTDSLNDYSATPVDATVSFSSANNYSFTMALVPVPEPTTIAAGAMLLLPLGLSCLQILRKRQSA